MLKGYLNPVLEFVTAHRYHGCENKVKNLQYLCAVSITRNRKIIAEDVPPKLFRFLLQSAIIQAFSDYNKGIFYGQFDNIEHILLHWPEASLIFTDFFPLSVPSWACDRVTFLMGRIYKFHKFISRVINTIVRIFLKKSNYFYHLRLLNISGFIFEESLHTHHSWLLKQIKEIPADCEPRVLVIDAIIGSNSLKELDELINCAGFGLVVHVNKIILSSAPSTVILKSLSAIKDELIQYVELELTDASQSVAEEISNSFENCLCGFRASYVMNMTDFSFLTRCHNLQQLSITSSQLTGKMQFLSSLTNSLNYLCLSGCRLMFSDLIHIKNHSGTLCHLDLSGNNLGKKEVETLIHLIPGFCKLTILELQECRLHLLEQSLLRSFIQSLIENCRDLSVLNVLLNDFSHPSLSNNLSLLAKMPHLSLYLSVSSDAYRGDDNLLYEQRIISIENVFIRKIKEEKTESFVTWEKQIHQIYW